MIRGRFVKPQHPSRSACRFVLIASAGMIAVFQICGSLGIRFNLSPSLPMGIYIASKAGKLVEFCPAEPFAALAIERGYRDQGSCPDGAAPLLKPVVAVGGDSVELSERGLAVNGSLLPDSAPLAADTKGRPLHAWPPGRSIVPEGMLWVISSYNPRSFDSRYFGPIPTTAVRDHVRPLLTEW